MNDDFDEARYAFQMHTYTAHWHLDPKNFNSAMNLPYEHPREKCFFIIHKDSRQIQHSFAMCEKSNLRQHFKQNVFPEKIQTQTGQHFAWLCQGFLLVPYLTSFPTGVPTISLFL